MPRALLDACVPHRLRTELSGLDVTTAQYAGLDELSDGQLLVALEGRFDVLVTLDRGIVQQQAVAGRPFAVVLMRVSDQTPGAFRALIPDLVREIGLAKPGEVRRIG